MSQQFVDPRTPLPRPEWVREINREGAIWQAAGMLPDMVPLDGESLLAAARRETGLDDFGDDDWREPLDVLTGSLEREAELESDGPALHAERADRLASQSPEDRRSRQAPSRDPGRADRGADLHHRPSAHGDLDPAGALLAGSATAYAAFLGDDPSGRVGALPRPGRGGEGERERSHPAVDPRDPRDPDDARDGGRHSGRGRAPYGPGPW